MTSDTPLIQVLSKENFEEQHLVSLQNAYPLLPLAPSAIRVQPSVISLTNNVLTNAALGHVFGWWDFHPLPPSIPAEYSDPSTYGRINTWGYGIVIESTSNIEVGTQIYGYLPIGTLPIDKVVEYNPEVPGRFQEVSPVYNRYFFAPNAVTAEDREGQGYDALLRVLFETGWMMNRFVFAWEPSELSHPSGAGKKGWSFEDVQLTGATVLCFAVSSKTGISFAHQLKYGRPDDKKPSKVIAVGSASSKEFTEGSGLFDSVVDYAADEQDLLKVLGLNASSKVVVLEFGSRGGAVYRYAICKQLFHSHPKALATNTYIETRWVPKLKPHIKSITAIGIGDEPAAVAPDEMIEKLTAGAQIIPHFMDAGAVRAAGISILGEDGYFDAFFKDWNQCKAQGVVKGLELVWGEGMEDVGRGWGKLCRGQVRATEGLVFKLPVESVGKLQWKCE
jgi:hypothetical protein